MPQQTRTVSVPLAVRAALVSVRLAVSGPAAITGASLVPVMVIVTVTVSLAGVPLLSVTVTV